LRLWSAGTGRLLLRLAMASYNDEARLAFGPGGKTLAILTDYEFLLVDTAAGKVLRRHSWPQGGEGAVRCLAVAPDLGTVAGGCFDRTVRLHDAGSGKEVRRIAHEDMVQRQIPLALEFTPDSKTLLVARSYSSEVVGYEVATGRPVRRLRG